MSPLAARAGQPITTMPSARIADATTRLFWPGRFLLATSRRPGESCTSSGSGGGSLAATAET